VFKWSITFTELDRTLKAEKPKKLKKPKTLKNFFKKPRFFPALHIHKVKNAGL